MQVAMGFVGNYAPCGLSPQMYDIPVIHKSRVTLGLHGFAMLGSLLGLRRRLGIVWRLGEVYGMYLLRRGGLGLGIEDVSERAVVVFPLGR